jgi:enoyl-CoA hydratase/carnithine racemase
VVTAPAPGVGLLELDRPERRNALDRGMLDSLPGILRALDDDPAVGVLVITGRGGAFCAGGDLDLIGELGQETAEEAHSRMVREFSATQEIAGSTLFTIAVVEGAAVGAGLALALACDLRVAGPTCALASPFIRMGLVPDFGMSWLLTRAVGRGRATELALTGRTVRADEALGIGLVDRVVDRPLDAALAAARAMAEAPPGAADATTRLIAAAVDRSLDEMIDLEIAEQIEALGRDEFGERLAAWSRAVRRQASAVSDRSQ